MNETQYPEKSNHSTQSLEKPIIQALNSQYAESLMTNPGTLDRLFEELNVFFTESRLEKMKEVLKRRTSYLRLALQDIHDPHNVAACMRSAEAFGISDIDVLTLTPPKRKPSNAARGVDSWLNVTPIKLNIDQYVHQLRSQGGFKVAAGFPPHKADMQLEEIPLDHPLCIVFGNEHAGLHDDWAQLVDYRFTIPTVGFVESLNISVSAAITIHHLRERALRSVEAQSFFLNESQIFATLETWIANQFGLEKTERILRRCLSYKKSIDSNTTLL